MLLLKRAELIGLLVVSLCVESGVSKDPWKVEKRSTRTSRISLSSLSTIFFPSCSVR